VTEERITDPTTGGEKGRKLARFDLIPARALWHLAEHFGRGASKYADRNWERGYAWSLSFGAIMRHLWAFWGGEDHDKETGSHHLDAVMWHAMVLRTFAEDYPEHDDRPPAHMGRHGLKPAHNQPINESRWLRGADVEAWKKGH
jgi:hypothetical protein